MWQIRIDFAIAEIENLALNQMVDKFVEIIQQLDVDAEGVEKNEDGNKRVLYFSLDFSQ